MHDLPSSARIVIIGGGVGGASIAYHLAELGVTDVVLVDRDELTNGSTFHSAGLVGQLRSSVNLTKMMMYSVELYSKLSEDPDTSTGWTQSGGIRLACTPEREEELRRQVGWARTFGLPLEEITAEQAQALFPLMSTEGVRAATFLPTDGYLDPSQLTHALARVARAKGVQIHTGTRVTGIEVRDGRVVGVETSKGRIRAEAVVNAGGMYAAEIGRMAGVRIPVVPFSHQYLVTTGFRNGSDLERLPTLRDPDLLVYYREDARGLVMGGYERNSSPAFLNQHLIDEIPPDFNGRLLEEDWSRFEEIAANSAKRVPLMADVEIRRLINGPEGFTPDNEFCLGETEVKGFFVAAGFCAHGIAGAGGIGKVMAEWIAEGEPSLDLWEMDVRRFGRHYGSYAHTLARTRETYQSYYDIVYPNHEKLAGRPLKRPAAFEWHRDRGAFFGEKSGWERVNYYHSNADESLEWLRPEGWAGRNWSTAIAAEHLVTRRSAALFDESSFSKLEISGPGSAAFLNQIATNNVAKGPGRTTYTQLLNSRGGIEADLTMTQLDEERFLVVTGTAFGKHDMSWITSQLPNRHSITLRDVTGAFSCYGLWGPSARKILSELTDADLSNAGFGYMRAREINVGSIPVIAVRITYVGELGWELYCSTEYGQTLWESLIEAGAPSGLVPAGYRAIDSLRLEKGYLVWGSDITPDESPLEAGLDFCIRWDKPGGFTGLEGLKGRVPERRLVCLVLDEHRQVALGNEPIRIGSSIAGRVTSGGLGYSLEASIAYGYLPAEQATPGTRAEICIFGKWIGATVSTSPLFDPEMRRIKADG